MSTDRTDSGIGPLSVSSVDPSDRRPRVLVLLGPTGIGKTAVGVELAERLGGEIVAADSRQIYRGLAIGSAAPTDEERRRAPHHLTGFLPPDAEYSVADFRDAAEADIADILARGRQPLVVGGTGFYLSSLVYGWSLTGVTRDEAVRERLEAMETGALVARLKQVDPEAAERLAPTDRKRLVRALEVHEVSGRPLSEHHREAGTRPVPYGYELFGLRLPREVLYPRLDARVAAMLAAGWLDEVKALLASGLTGDEQAMEGLGYRRLVTALRGETTLETAVALTQRDTRRYAKRQMTWFRAMTGVTWLEAEAEPAILAQRILGLWPGGRAT